MARLDRLGGAREVAQVAAVIGRQFTFALLEAIAGKDDGSSNNCWRSWSPRESSFPRSAASNGVSSSSTRWCVTPPMKACCWRAAANGTGASPRRWSNVLATIAAQRTGIAGLSFRRAGLLSLGLRLPHARWRPGREPLGLCGSDRPFHGGSQARRSYAATRRPAPATGVLAETRRGVGRRAWPAERRGRNSLHQSQRDRRAARRRPGLLPGQMGPLDQRQSEAQDRLGARPRRRTGVARATVRRPRVVARSLSLPACDGVFSRRRPRRAGGLPARHRALRHDAAPSSCACVWWPRSRRLRPHPVRQLLAAVGRRTTGEASISREASHWPKCSIIQTVSRMGCTTSVSAISWGATATPLTRRRIARRRWQKSSACRHGARAA